MLLGIRLYSTRGLKSANKSIFKSSAFRIQPKSKSIMDTTAGSTTESLSNLSLADQAGPSSNRNSHPERGREKKDKGKGKSQKSGENTHQKQASKANPSKSTKLRGLEKDSPEVRISKTLSWLLRHGAQGEGLAMRKDGYVKVVDLIEHPKLKAQNIDLEKIKAIVKADSKQRYDLRLEDAAGVKLMTFGEDAPVIESQSATTEEVSGTTSQVSKPESVVASASSEGGLWWIKARQGHSIKTVELELKPINSVADIPTGMAVHGTNRLAWQAISIKGLSKMKRNHIHLAQNVAGQNVVSGMRTSSPILIYIDVPKALAAGVKFWLSDNGVVLTEGDEHGILSKKYFSKVVDVKEGELKGWETEDT